MTPADAERERLLSEVVRREAHHLATTDARLFVRELTAADIMGLASNIDLAERVDAFVARDWFDWGRLQDTLAGVLLPRLLVRAPGACRA